MSLKKGIVPKEFKLAKVTPIFKSGDPKVICNYRPISLLSIFDKLLERLVCNRLTDFLNRYNILYDYQFGFRKKHSTSLALIDTIDKIYEYLDKKENVIGIYFDLQKAFDAVDHSILLNKLYNYGIRGALYEWLKNYLCDRTQFTMAKGCRSSLGNITHGVPQGSILGPILFLCYCNDICNAIPESILRLFADDTNLFVHDRNIETLISVANTQLQKLNNWFLANKLSLNINKTCFTLFTKKKIQIDCVLKINNIQIKRVPFSKYLGVIIDENLTWSKHIAGIVSKITRFAGIFYKLREILSRPVLKTIYFSMIYPHILYGIELYANTCMTYLEPLIKANNKLLRIIQNKHFRSHTNDLYLNFNSLPIPLLFKFQIYKFLHRFNHFRSSQPSIYQNYFTFNTFFHHHLTRRQLDLHKFSTSTSIGQRQIKFIGVTLWNELGSELKIYMSPLVFKLKIKKFLQTNLVA